MLKLDRQFGLYVIREQLALGDSKACCRAEDPFFDRDVVLKLVTPVAVGSEERLKPLDSYLESVSGLEHPSIAPLYDNGIEEDICYFTTVFYADGSLADQLTKPINIGRALRIILQLCSGLSYAYNEGFEHGKLRLEDIFFSENDHAVITDFGIALTVENLRSSGEQTGEHSSQSRSIETLYSLGEILIKLLLGPGAKPDSVSTAILEQSHSAPVFSLVIDLLGVSENQINSFDELFNRLTDLAVHGSEVGINEYIEYVENTQTLPHSENIEGLKPQVTPSQRQLEIKEAVYAKGEIRRLVAEKSKLQEILRRAVSYKKHAELKLAAAASALEIAQKSEIRAKNELQMATFNITNQDRNQWHPGVWVATGLLFGVLLSSGYNYYYQPKPEILLQAQTPAPVQQKAPELASAPVSTKTQTEQTSEILPEPKQTPVFAPVEEQTTLWWPVGSEFDTTAAVPLSLVTEQILAGELTSPADGSQLQNQQIISDQQDESGNEIPDKSMSGIQVAAGDEFNSATKMSPQGDAEKNCQEVLCVIQDWAEAWSNQDQESYFSYYSEQYRPELGRSQEEWRSMRLSRLTRPEWIKVMLHDFKLRSISKDRVQVKLKQSYSSNYYQDQISKSLNLIKENGKWRIFMERSLGVTRSNSASNDMIGG